MNEVTVYTTNTCPYCVMLKNYLEAQSIDYKDVDVQKNPEAMQYVVNKTGQMGVPQSQVNGEWVLGFDPDKLVTLLK